MKTLLTANYDSVYLDQLSRFMEIHQASYALGEPLLTEDQLIQALQGVDLFIIGYDNLTERVIRAAPDLKLIASIRGGPEANINLDAATAAGIPVLYTVGRTERAVAEYTILLMLCLARSFCKASRQTRDGSLVDPASLAPGKQDNTSDRDVVWPLNPGTAAYKAHRALFGTELFAKNLGIVGFGNIGRAVARLGQSFGMQALAYDPYAGPDTFADAQTQSVDLPTLMAESDYITLHAKLTSSSRGMIGREELRLMKPSAYLVNTARAALVDEPALLTALEEGWFRAAALDVYHREPLTPDHPLLAIDPDRVLLSPHMSGNTREIEQHHSRLLTPTMMSYFQGSRPQAVANPAVFTEQAYAGRGARLFGMLNGD